MNNNELELKLRCHICGKPITTPRFGLTSQVKDPIDKVFAVHADGECLEQIQDDQPTLVAAVYNTPESIIDVPYASELIDRVKLALEREDFCECGHRLGEHQGGQGQSWCEQPVLGRTLEEFGQCPCNWFRKRSS